MSWLGHNKCSIFTNRLTDLIYPEHWMTLQKKIGNWGTKSCLEFENPIQNTEETWILVKLTCSVTELDYVKVFGREPSTGFGKRGNEAVGPLSGSQESWALLSAWLSVLISTTDIPESTVQPRCCVQAGGVKKPVTYFRTIIWLIGQERKAFCSYGWGSAGTSASTELLITVVHLLQSWCLKFPHWD